MQAACNRSTTEFGPKKPLPQGPPSHALKLIRNNGGFPGIPPGFPVGEWSFETCGDGIEWRLIALGDVSLSSQTGHRAPRPGDRSRRRKAYENRDHS